MPLKTTKFDAAEYLDTPESIRPFLEDALASDDPCDLILAMSTAMRSRGMAVAARQAGLGSDADEIDFRAEVHRLRRDCAEAYQVIGAAMLGDELATYTQDDVVRALDNLIAACNGEPRPHEDLLPWPAQ